MGPICDCGLCGGRSLVLLADDDKRGFALSQRCADKTGVLDEYKVIAEGVKEFTQGDSVKVALPPWKTGSIAEYCIDLPTLLRALGANNRYFVRADGPNTAEIYTPEEITKATPSKVSARA